VALNWAATRDDNSADWLAGEMEPSPQVGGWAASLVVEMDASRVAFWMVFLMAVHSDVETVGRKGNSEAEKMAAYWVC